MLLENKNAVIYGGAIGGAVAGAFAREGANLFLVGRTRETLQTVAAEVMSAGSSAEVAVLDAMDEQAVGEHVLELAVPKLSADLKPTSSQLLWIMDAYGFLLTGFLITMGTLGDRIGRRRLLVIGAAAFGAASVLAAFSTSAETLIAARGLLGIAGATLAPSTLSSSLVAFLLSIFVIAGIFFFIAQYLQLVLGLSPLRAGLWTLPSACGLIAGSMLAPLVARRVRPAFVMAGGLALSTVGFGMLTQVTAASGLLVLVTASVIFSLGVAPVGTLPTDIVVGSVSPGKAGSASATSETSAELGGALGVAILGSIGTAAYRNHVAKPSRTVSHTAPRMPRAALWAAPQRPQGTSPTPSAPGCSTLPTRPSPRPFNLVPS